MAIAAKFREKQQVKDVQKLNKREEKTLIPKDPTESVFETLAEEKPVEIQLVRPEPEPRINSKKKKKVHQRVRKLKKKIGRSGT